MAVRRTALLLPMARMRPYWPARVTAAESSRTVGENQDGDRGGTSWSFARGTAGQGLPIHPRTMDEAHLFSSIPGVRAEYSLGRELDATNHFGSQELDPYWKSTSRIESGHHTFSHRNLPTAEDLAARLSVGRATRLSRRPHAATAGPNPNRLGRSASVIGRLRVRQPCACSDAYGSRSGAPFTT